MDFFFFFLNQGCSFPLSAPLSPSRTSPSYLARWMAFLCSVSSSAHCSSVTAHACSALSHDNWETLKTTCETDTHRCCYRTLQRSCYEHHFLISYDYFITDQNPVSPREREPLCQLQMREIYFCYSIPMCLKFKYFTKKVEVLPYIHF